MALSLPVARRILQNGLSEQTSFDVLAAIAYHGTFEDRNVARDLLIRVLNQREQVPAALQAMLQDLVREHGLFPYLRDIIELRLADRLAYEAHRRALAPAEDIIFHAEQAMVFERLFAGENVVLSAPTSFGKSLVVDAILAIQGFRNAAVVVPTIALMDECRRRLSRLRDKYKIITHSSQRLSERNLFVMTQERLLEVRKPPPMDFFVIDEFYKLDPAHSLDPAHNAERVNQLNILFHQLLATGAQFYLLGPNITGLAERAGQRLRATFISTDFTTVATDVERIKVSSSELPNTLAEVCGEVGPGTLIFCRSPKRIREVAQWLLERGVSGGHNLEGAADWIAQAYHPDWLVGRALRQGIGIHHGRLPRALGHHIVRLFNEGRLPYLLVTNTLIEGVNTTARNVLVLDNKIATKKYDYFTYSNIRGRSGRMLRHFVGRVVIFNPEPQPAPLTVDIPVLSQPTDANEEILIQLPDGELTEQSRQRMSRYYEQTLVSLDTLRRNKGVSPAQQLEVAGKMAAEPQRWVEAITWNGPYPTAQQVRNLSELLFTLTGSSSTVRTAAQLGALVNILRFHRGNLRALAEQQINERGVAADDAVESVLDFARNWAQFKIPTALKATGNLAGDVLGSSGYRTTDPAVFAGELENLFLPPFVVALEEYGLPTSLTIKLEPLLNLRLAANLDDALSRLRELDPAPPGLLPFEQEMLLDTRAAL